MNTRQVLNNSRFTFPEKLNFIKTRENHKQIQKIIKGNHFLLKYLNKGLFINELDKIILNDPLYFTNDFIKEFIFIKLKIESQIHNLKEFIDLKNLVEKQVFTSQYIEALDNLELIISKFGYSLWSIEMELLIKENSEGTEANWRLLSEYIKTIQNPFYDFYISSYSKRIESALSFENILNHFQKEINQIEASDFIQDFFVFKNFKIASYEYSYDDLSGVLYTSNIFSIIDQYLVLIDIIIFNINNNKNNHFELYTQLIKFLIDNNVNDDRLVNIYNYLSNENLKEFVLDNSIYDLQNYYYNGDFVESFKISKKLIVSNPLEIDLYEFYVKSLINLNRPLEKVNIKEIDNILLHLYSLFLFDKSSSASHKELMKLSLKYQNFNIGLRIKAIIAEIDNELEFDHKFNFYCSYNSHRILNNRLSNYSNLLLKYNGLDQKFHSYKSLIYNLPNASLDNFSSKCPFLEFNAKVYFYFYNGDYEKVIALLFNTPEFNSTINYYKERYIYLLFKSFLYTNDIHRCLELFGYVYFDNSIYFVKFSEKILYEKIFIELDKYEYVNNFYTLILASLFLTEYDLYEILDEYLDSKNISIEDIDELRAELSKSEYIYLLNKICINSTIKYYFTEADATDKFRVKLLKLLLEVDDINENVYKDEIYQINKNISVRRVIKEVNQSRLYVDISKLKVKLTEKNNEDFTRLLKLFYEKQSVDLINFNINKSKNFNKYLVDQELNVTDEYNKADFIAFKNIFFDVREHFLFDKAFGLDSSLSTRIRHGALENEIRSVFENLNLLTTTIEDNYIDSDYWSNIINNHSKNIAVQKLLKRFSKEIDNYCSVLKNNVIQITIDISENKYALFNYTTNDEILFKFYTENIDKWTDTESIIEYILDLLAFETNAHMCLNVIHTYLNVNVYDDISKYVENFKSELQSLSLSKNVYIKENLTKSLTDLQICLERISEWFYLETSLDTALLKIDEIIEASFEMTRSLYTNVNIKKTLNLKDKDFVANSSLIYVFNILISNAIIHSGFEDCVEIEVNSEIYDGKFIKIDFKNRHNITDISTTINKLQNIKDNWKDYKKIERSNVEGQSGFDKIKRILIYEAKCISDKFDFVVESDSTMISLYLFYTNTIKDEDSNNRG